MSNSEPTFCYVPSPVNFEEVSTSSSPISPSFPPPLAILTDDSQDSSLEFPGPVPTSPEAESNHLFAVKWENFEDHLKKCYEDAQTRQNSLPASSEIVTIACRENGDTASPEQNRAPVWVYFRAKRSILAGSSPLLRRELEERPDERPVFLWSIKQRTMAHIMQYIQYGTVFGPVAYFPDFVKAAKELKIGAVWPEEYNVCMGTIIGTDRETIQIIRKRPWVEIREPEQEQSENPPGAVEIPKIVPPEVTDKASPERDPVDQTDEKVEMATTEPPLTDLGSPKIESLSSTRDSDSSEELASSSIDSDSSIMSVPLIIDLRSPTIESDSPTFETNLPTIETDLPTIETDLPTIETDLPTIETDLPAIESELPTIKTELPAIETDLPTIKTDLPTIESGFSMMESGLPTIETDSPAPESDLPTTEPGLPTIESGLSTIESGLPTIETNSAATESDLPAKDVNITPSKEMKQPGTSVNAQLSAPPQMVAPSTISQSAPYNIQSCFYSKPRWVPPELLQMFYRSVQKNTQQKICNVTASPIDKRAESPEKFLIATPPPPPPNTPYVQPLQNGQPLSNMPPSNAPPFNPLQSTPPQPPLLINRHRAPTTQPVTIMPIASSVGSPRIFHSTVHFRNLPPAPQHTRAATTLTSNIIFKVPAPPKRNPSQFSLSTQQIHQLRWRSPNPNKRTIPPMKIPPPTPPPSPSMLQRHCCHFPNVPSVRKAVCPHPIRMESLGKCQLPQSTHISVIPQPTYRQIPNPSTFQAKSCHHSYQHQQPMAPPKQPKLDLCHRYPVPCPCMGFSQTFSFIEEPPPPDPEPQSCGWCGLIFISKWELRQHYLIVHKQAESLQKNVAAQTTFPRNNQGNFQMRGNQWCFPSPAQSQPIQRPCWDPL